MAAVDRQALVAFAAQWCRGRVTFLSAAGAWSRTHRLRLAGEQTQPYRCPVCQCHHLGPVMSKEQYRAIQEHGQELILSLPQTERAYYREHGEPERATREAEARRAAKAAARVANIAAREAAIAELATAAATRQAAADQERQATKAELARAAEAARAERLAAVVRELDGLRVRLEQVDPDTWRAGVYVRLDDGTRRVLKQTGPTEDAARQRLAVALQLMRMDRTAAAMPDNLVDLLREAAASRDGAGRDRFVAVVQVAVAAGWGQRAVAEVTALSRSRISRVAKGLPAPAQLRAAAERQVPAPVQHAIAPPPQRPAVPAAASARLRDLSAVVAKIRGRTKFDKGNQDAVAELNALVLALWEAGHSWGQIDDAAGVRRGTSRHRLWAAGWRTPQKENGSNTDST